MTNFKRAIFARMFLLMCTAAPVFAAGTLEQYLSAPFASNLIAAPKGGKVAWVLDEQGARNLWVAEAPDYKARRLTKYTEDDGQEIGDIAWSLDGRTMVYTRGGDLSADVANPQALTQNPELAIYAVPLAAPSIPRKLAQGGAAAIAPDGRVAFLRNGQVWLTTLAGTAPNLLIQTKGRASELIWSPTGDALAFTDSRGDHSFIGVYHSATKKLVYLDPSVDRDASPVWSPDSSSIALIRQAYSSHYDIGPLRETPDPWSIRIADATSGIGHEVWHAGQGPGSVFRAVTASRQIFWMTGDRLVFPWEKTGWLHLYSIPAQGTNAPAQPLTTGAFEVEYASPSLDGSSILISSNQDDPDRRHVWRISLTTGQTQRELAGNTDPNIDFQPVDLGTGTTAFLRSSATAVSHAAIKLGTAAHDLAPESVSAGFPKDLVAPQSVIFPAADGLQLHGQLFLPPNAATETRHPAVVFFHGGPKRQMLLGFHNMRYYSHTYAMNQFLASQGYIVLSVNYRSGTGYGLNFREANNFGNSGASEYLDIVGTAKFLAAQPNVDVKRIGAWGGSVGGYLTALALARSSDLFAVGVDLHGVHDWSIRPDRVLNAMNMNELHDAEVIARQASPLADVGKWKSPVLLVHGDDDRNVTFSQTVKLVEALRRQHVEFEQLILPNEIHTFLLHESWLKTFHAASNFLNRYLNK